MNDVQENRRSMARAVKASLQKYATRVATIPAFGKAKNDLDNLLASMDGLEIIQKLDRTGVTTDKNVAEDNAIEAVVKACKRAANYATDAGDNASKPLLPAQAPVSKIPATHRLKQTWKTNGIYYS